MVIQPSVYAKTLYSIYGHRWEATAQMKELIDFAQLPEWDWFSLAKPSNKLKFQKPSWCISLCSIETCRLHITQESSIVTRIRKDNNFKLILYTKNWRSFFKNSTQQNISGSSKPDSLCKQWDKCHPGKPNMLVYTLDQRVFVPSLHIS